MRGDGLGQCPICAQRGGRRNRLVAKQRRVAAAGFVGAFHCRDWFRGEHFADLTGGGSASVNLPYNITPLAGITSRASGITVNYAQGDGASTAAAVSLAQTSQVAIVCVGQQTSEGSDRTSLSLPNNEDALISAVAAVNTNTIVVMYESSATLMPWANQVAGSADGVVSGTGKWQRAGSGFVRGREPIGETSRDDPRILKPGAHEHHRPMARRQRSRDLFRRVGNRLSLV